MNRYGSERRKLCLTALFAVVLLVAAAVVAVFVLAPAKMYAEQNAAWTTDGGWTVTGEGESAVYQKTEAAYGGAPAITYNAAPDFNTLEFTALLNAENGETNFTLSVFLENGYFYALEFRHAGNFSTRFRRYFGNYQYETIISEGACAFTPSVTDEIPFKFIFDKYYLEMYVNGVSERFSFDTFSDFSVSKLVISSWNTLGTVKSIRTSTTDLSSYMSGWHADGGWTVTGTGATAVYDKTVADGSSSVNYNSTPDFNTIEMDVTVNDIVGVEGEVPFRESNLGLNLFMTDGRIYFLEVNYGQNSVRFRETSRGDNWLSYGECGYTYTKGKEHKVRFVFCENFFEVTVDGHSRMHSFPRAITGYEIEKISLSAFNTKPTVKNLTTSVSDTKLPFAWMPGGWTTTGSGDNTEYTAPIDGNPVTMTHSGEFEWNTIEFYARPNSYRFPEGGFGVIFNCNGGETSYYFESFNDGQRVKHVRLRRGNTYLGGADIALKDNEFVKFKVVFDDNYILFYINETRVLALFDTYGDTFDKQVKFNGWGVAPTIKNIVVTTSLVDYAAAGYVDFEFGDERALSCFTATGGSARIAAGKYVVSVTGSDPTLTSTVIDVTRGSDYSALLTVRNTFLIRIKNATAANRVKLSFITSEDGAYNDNKSKIFDIAPDMQDFGTYYINLSDLAGCKGYLRGFKLQLLGATSGEVAIDAITFEREDPIYNYAGSIVSCTADKTAKTVAVTGTVGADNAGKTVTIATTPVNNYTLDPQYDGKAYGNPTNNTVVPVWTGKAAADGAFTAEFPLQNGVVTHLSSKFIAYLPDNTLVSTAFRITNYRDFSENPYAFTLNARTVDVTTAPYNAKGDGFTNDNAAIQAAIDAVSAAGGGTVLLPGDKSDPFGRRYIATHLVLKDNIELRIEEGAVLWQSKRADEYDYKVTYGHDVDIEGLVWCHAGGTVNLPFVYANGKKNVRVTGGGTIRMMESGTEQPDGYHYAWSTDGTPNITLDCGNTIHIIPVAMYDCENCELSDITILRTNVWHTLWMYSRNLYIANNDFRQAECINGDGFSLGQTKNVVLERNYLYSNDDAITLTNVYYDGRGDLFYPSVRGSDHSTENLVIRHNNLFGGLGLTFIPWGSEDPDMSLEETKNITVYDNIIGGTSRAIGSWPDNPHYGWSKYYDYNLDNGEIDDYSPTKDIFIHDNIFRNTVAVGVMKITNAITDCGLYSADNFVYPSFEREFRYRGEVNFKSGLSYWSSKTGENGEVGTEKVGTKKAIVKYPKFTGSKDETVDTTSPTEYTVSDYAGYVKGNGELYQGLNAVLGAYKFTARVKLVSGSAKMFARDGRTGTVLAEKTVEITTDFATVTLDYTTTDATTVQLGIMHEGEATDIVYIDDASVAPTADEELFKVEGDGRTWNFDDRVGFDVYGNRVDVSGGLLAIPDGAERKIIFGGTENAKTFDARVDIVKSNSAPVNAGIYFAVGDVQGAQDRIDAYNVHVDYNPQNDYFNVYLYKFSVAGGYMGALAKSENLPMPTNGRISLRVVVKNNTVYAFVGSGVYVLAFKLPSDYAGGSVGLRSFARTDFDSFSLTVQKDLTPVVPDPDRTALNSSLMTARAVDKTKYTEESYAALAAAIAKAEALSATATQEQIDAVKSEIDKAMEELKSVEPPTPVKPEKPDEPGDNSEGVNLGLAVGLPVGLVVAAAVAVAVIVIIKKKKASNK